MRLGAPAFAALLFTVGAVTPFTAPSRDSEHKFWSPKARLAAITRAHVWMPTDVASKDLVAGPMEPDAFEPNAIVTCDYVDKKPPGHTPKFICAPTPADDAKVKYGKDNGEVYAEVAATRLFWALGFPADRMYPVRVVCHGCPPDPHSDTKERRPEVVFDPAAIERKLKGEAIEVKQDSGWAWPELDLVDESLGGAPVIQRDALKLLAAFLQHSDSKPEQQRLVCAGEDKHEAKAEDKHPSVEACADTVMMINDLGLTFGRANLFNTNASASANFEKWSETPVWFDDKHCVGNLTVSQSGTLDKPVISEGGRKFLADLLVQLTDAQLRDLFTVARFAERQTEKVRAASVEEWVSAFKKKRNEIVNRSCVAEIRSVR